MAVPYEPPSAQCSTRPIIEVRDLTAGYPEYTVLTGLNFAICEGEIFGLLGGSGCGKSTLLKHMIGLIPPLSGAVLIDGEDINKAQGRARLDILRKIGVMYQAGALFGSMSLIENVMLPLEEHTSLPADARLLTARLKLRLVGLQGFEHSLPSEISGGMRKRAAIARAMALDPQIIFLDEPSAGLDPITSADLDRLILRLSRSLGITVVMVTHELPSILATNDRVLMLDKPSRSAIALGPPKELQQSEDPRICRFFNRRSNDQTALDDPSATAENDAS